MAVHKAIRSNPPAQPQPKPARHRPDHQLKAEIFETLRHLNRGYGVALAAFDKLETKDRHRGPRAFPAGFVEDTATAQKLSAHLRTATCSASSPGAKNWKPSDLAFSAARRQNQKAHSAPDRGLPANKQQAHL